MLALVIFFYLGPFKGKVFQGEKFKLSKRKENKKNRPNV